MSVQVKEGRGDFPLVRWGRSRHGRPETGDFFELQKFNIGEFQGLLLYCFLRAFQARSRLLFYVFVCFFLSPCGDARRSR
jgi:hypothetical protein